jgi:hypothetical protein
MTITIVKPDYSQATGEVVNVNVHEMFIALANGVKGIETIVWYTVEDENGNIHTGTKQ